MHSRPYLHPTPLSAVVPAGVEANLDRFESRAVGFTAFDLGIPAGKPLAKGVP